MNSLLGPPTTKVHCNERYKLSINSLCSMMFAQINYYNVGDAQRIKLEMTYTPTRFII